MEKYAFVICKISKIDESGDYDYGIVFEEEKAKSIVEEKNKICDKIEKIESKLEEEMYEIESDIRSFAYDDAKEDKLIGEHMSLILKKYDLTEEDFYENRHYIYGYNKIPIIE